MSTASSGLHGPARTLLVANAVIVVIALIPCLGWINWMAILLCMATMSLGAVGWLTIPEPNRSTSPKGPYVAAILGGMLLLGVSCFRLLLGGGVI